MNYVKIRKSLIILLLLVNVFLAINLFNMHNSSNQQYNYMITQNITTLENNEIYITRELYEQNNQIYPIIEFDNFITTENITQILGEIQSSDNNLYISREGSANIQSNGFFTITLNKQYAQDEIVNKLIMAGFNMENMSVLKTSEGVEIDYRINDMDVLNCGVKVILNNSNTLIEGNWIFYNDAPVETNREYNLMQMLLQINQPISLINEIENIETYYYLSYENGIKLIPYFKIISNNSEFYVDIYGKSLLN